MNSENTTTISGETDSGFLLYSDNVYEFISIRLKNFDNWYIFKKTGT